MIHTRPLFQANADSDEMRELCMASGVRGLPYFRFHASGKVLLQIPLNTSWPPHDLVSPSRLWIVAGYKALTLTFWHHHHGLKCMCSLNACAPGLIQSCDHISDLDLHS